MNLKYCSYCVMPNSKPNMKFDKDICQSCKYHYEIKKKKIIWNKRKKEFELLIKKIKRIKSENFDALVPVSGGKDSITQVHHLVTNGLRVLALNIDYGFKTRIGEYNLNLIPKMGASLFTFRPNLKIHKKILKISFEKYGDPDLMSHCMLHALPIRTAIKFKIPLVFLGENSALEYSGDTKFDPKKITAQWFNKYAANSNNTPLKFAKRFNIPYEQIKVYDLPSKNDLSKTTAVFCSYFFKWSSENNLKIAKRYGFKTLKSNSEGTYRNYVGIDEKINRIHQYLKFLKFGYGRATDHACEDIRNGKINRRMAITLVKKYDRAKITKFFYKDFINFIGIKEKNFFKILNKFTNFNLQKKIINIK